VLTMTYGSAFQSDIASDEDTSRIRVYCHGGKTYVGHDSSDHVHVCDKGCMFQVVDDTVFAPADIDSRTFVSIDTDTRPDGLTYVTTIDVGDFDPGDDPYVLCGACGAELLRDDDRFYEQYGRHIGER
jgi:hypothetical protein